ncbi:MAG: hypothetical protein IKQ24_09300 [Verrucomicrobia bacterium]|nr:hypothetical protein [Verrucomicrobiota bacterium]
MFKLLKYEFRKTWYTKAILLVLTLIAQAAFLIGIFFDKDETLGLSVASLVMLATFGIMVIGLVSLIVFHQDLNTKQSYMLFMTPNSSYKILGAKALENGLSVFLSGVFFALLGLADISILVAHEGDLMAVVDMFRSLIEQLQSYLVFDAKNIITVFFAGLSNWLMTLSAAFLAIVIAATFLAGKKFSGVVSFLLFLLLIWGLEKVIGFIPDMSTLFMDMVLTAIASFVLMVVLYLVTGWIMDKKLSV